LKVFRFGAWATALCACMHLAAAKTAPPPSRDARTPASDSAALLKTLGIPCTISGALKLPAPAPASPTRRGKARPPQPPERFEVSCREGLGYLLTSAAGPDDRPDAALCLESGAAGTPGACTLPGNHADAQRATLAALLRQTPRSGCAIDHYRFAGRSVVNTYIEVVCHDGEGLMLAASNPFDPTRKSEALPCLGLPESGAFACQLTTRQAAIAAMTAAAEAQFTRESGRIACKVQSRRYILSDSAGNSYYEFLCQGGANYVMARRADGSFGGSDECGSPRAADLGGCRLGQRVN